jgi:hypothetical protein
LGLKPRQSRREPINRLGSVNDDFGANVKAMELSKTRWNKPQNFPRVPRNKYSCMTPGSFQYWKPHLLYPVAPLMPIDSDKARRQANVPTLILVKSRSEVRVYLSGKKFVPTTIVMMMTMRNAMVNPGFHNPGFTIAVLIS